MSPELKPSAVYRIDGFLRGRAIARSPSPGQVGAVPRRLRVSPAAGAPQGLKLVFSCMDVPEPVPLEENHVASNRDVISGIMRAALLCQLHISAKPEHASLLSGRRVPPPQLLLLVPTELCLQTVPVRAIVQKVSV